MIHRKRLTETLRREEQQAESRGLDSSQEERNHHFKPETKYLILHVQKISLQVAFLIFYFFCSHLYENKYGNLTGDNHKSNLREKQSAHNIKAHYTLIPELSRM